MNLPKEFEEKMKTLLGSEYEEYTACYDEPRHKDRTLAAGAGSVDREWILL